MYKSLLIFKYLRKRRIAWVSLIAVMLCTAMVLVVISVMSGWLTMFKAKFRGVSGDIVVYRNNVTGFGGYKDMLAEIGKLPEVDQAIPLIHTFGLINIANKDSQAVMITGLNLEEMSRFNKFRESLYRQYQQPVFQGKKPPEKATFDLLPNTPYEAYRPDDPRASQRPGMIVGGPVFGIKSDAAGQSIVPDYLFNVWCRLEVVPLSDDTRSLRDATPSANVYWVVDISRTKLFQLDDQHVFVPFDVLQKDLHMGEQSYEEEIDGKRIARTKPARCSEIQINIKPGADRMAVVASVNDIVQRITDGIESKASTMFSPIHVEPWEKKQERFLGAVENEISLMTFLLGLISLVAIFLIFCILYMIVVEKTRDIGIIKSVGATSQGIAVIFLGYGAAIGIVGGTAGLIAGWIVMTWINEIHSGVSHLIGRPIWDPEVYAFDKIPDSVDPKTAAIVLAVAVGSAIIGAVVPAVRAARLNPVEALRFE